MRIEGGSATQAGRNIFLRVVPALPEFPEIPLLFGSIGIPLYPQAELIFFPQSGNLLHHFGLMMKVKGLGIAPAVDQEDGFGILHWKKIFISFVSRFCTDSLDDSAGHHFFRKKPGTAGLSRII